VWIDQSHAKIEPPTPASSSITALARALDLNVRHNLHGDMHCIQFLGDPIVKQEKRRKLSLQVETGRESDERNWYEGSSRLGRNGVSLISVGMVCKLALGTEISNSNSLLYSRGFDIPVCFNSRFHRGYPISSEFHIRENLDSLEGRQVLTSQFISGAGSSELQKG